jgi:hypothetical protein
MPKAPQIDPHYDGPRNCRRLKRAARRFLRREGKRLLADAPKRMPYDGYSS